jgi:hypothetical protein
MLLLVGAACSSSGSGPATPPVGACKWVDAGYYLSVQPDGGPGYQYEWACKTFADAALLEPPPSLLPCQDVVQAGASCPGIIGNEIVMEKCFRCGTGGVGIEWTCVWPTPLNEHRPTWQSGQAFQCAQ